MIQRRKKLIEVALPLAAINKASAREKSIRHGHPSTLHLWWARRPLAACRAVLFSQLVDDPSSDPRYRIGGKVDEEGAGIKRAELFNLIEEMVKWENTNNPDVINRARAEIARCVASRKIELGELKKEMVIFGSDEGSDHPEGSISHHGVTAYEMVLMRCNTDVVNHFLAEYAPPVLDPFAGGGSIPLEAQRLGLRAHASDLNPVPVLINKALIEIPPKFAGLPPVNPGWHGKSESEKAINVWSGAHGLADDVRYYGQWMREQAEQRIGHLYPKVKITREMVEADREDLRPYLGKELTVIAWLWTRTVASPDPSVGGKHVPLVRSFWLSKRKGKEAYIRPVVDRIKGTYKFKVQVGKPIDGFDPNNGTVKRRGGTCLLTKTSMPFSYIRSEGQAGKIISGLMAIVAEGKRERIYLNPIRRHVEQAQKAHPKWAPLFETHGKCRVNIGLYGLTTWNKLFTLRQLTVLTTFSDLVKEARKQILADATDSDTLPPDNRPLTEGGTGMSAYADAVATYLAFVINKMADLGNALNRWEPNAQCPRQLFARQAIPMVWDFAEGNPFSNSSGSWNVLFRNLEHAFKSPSFAFERQVGAEVKQLDATTETTYSGEVVSCDPPYYDNISYADLSDFFYVWLRRSLQDVYPDLLSTVLTPKEEELIASPYRHNGNRQQAAAFFEEGLGSAIGQWRRNGNPDYPTTIFYAFKQAETDILGTASTGWETFLTGVINHGFTITGTWPIRTECGSRMVGQGTNALASSVALSCVPRLPDAPLATRREFLNALKHYLPEALRNLQCGNIAPVDLAQAAIGPGMGIFSRYAKVVEADGEPMTVRTALSLINQVLDEVLAEQEGEFDTDTRWAVAWFEQHGMDKGDFGVAETLSKAKNTSVKGLVEAGVVTSRGGKVQLVNRNDLPEEWNPSTDKRLTEWETVQHLIRALDRQGETGAADLLSQLGPDYSERARDLAYRLYSVCERKNWASEATAYNSLVLAWPELTKLARQTKSVTAQQRALF